MSNLALLGMLLFAGTESLPENVPALNWQVEQSSDGTLEVVAPGGGTAALAPVLVDGKRAATMTAAGQSSPAYGFEVGRLHYTLALASGEGSEIALLTTSDPHFRIDGLEVGMAWDDLVSVLGDVELFEETGWACYVCLQSGWGAFVYAPGTFGWPGSCESTIRGDSRISGFFQRVATCGN